MHKKFSYPQIYSTRALDFPNARTIVQQQVHVGIKIVFELCVFCHMYTSLVLPIQSRDISYVRPPFLIDVMVTY